MTRLLVGRRGAKSPASTPERDSQTLPQRRDASPKVHKSAPSGSFFTRQSCAMLVVGVLAGYIVVPIFLIETELGSSLGGLPRNQGANDMSGAGGYARVLADEGTALQRLLEGQEILTKQSLPTTTTPYIMKTTTLPDHQRKKILVTGGAGFVGSHLVDKLMMQGHEVTVVDNFFTGQKKNIAHWLHHPSFR